MQDPHELQAPSPWVVRWAALIPAGGAVLDVACGRGRHARHLGAGGYRVTAVDRDAEALATLAGASGIRTVHADLEGAPWPFEAGAFDGVVVANYLHRPLFGALAASLASGGVLIYETFMAGNERYGRPSNPEFLLRPYELVEAWRGLLAVVAFEQGRVERPKRAVIQRICALRTGIQDAMIA